MYADFPLFPTISIPIITKLYRKNLPLLQNTIPHPHYTQTARFFTIKSFRSLLESTFTAGAFFARRARTEISTFLRRLYASTHTHRDLRYIDSARVHVWCKSRTRAEFANLTLGGANSIVYICTYVNTQNESWLHAFLPK